MGSWCLKPQNSNTKPTLDNLNASSVKVQLMGEYSEANMQGINGENSKTSHGTNETSQTSFTKEDRETWALSQVENKEESEFFTKTINLIDFDILKMVGRGSFSKVYLVKKKDSGQYFAMKELKKSAMVNERKKRRIMTEK